MSEDKDNTKIAKINNNFDERKSYDFNLQNNLEFYSFLSDESSLGQTAIFIDNNEKDEKDGKDDDKYICIKKIEQPYADCSRGKGVLKYMSILTQVQHENIIKLKNIYISNIDNNNYDAYLFLEYAPTSVERLIESNYNYLENKKIVPFIIYQILMGVFYLHSCGIIHRNLNPSNILLDEYCRVKISGLSYAIYKDTYENTKNGETNDFTEEKNNLSFLAPEILSSKKKCKEDYDEKSDIWSIGCIFLALLFRVANFFPPIKRNGIKWESQFYGIFKKLGKPSKEEIEKFASKEREKDIKKFKNFPKLEKKELYQNLNDDNAIDLVEKFICINPRNRISILEAKDHPYFDIIKDWKKSDDFIFKGNQLKFSYKKRIDENEQKNLILNKQKEFYKNQISLLEGEYNEEEDNDYNDNDYNDKKSDNELSTKSNTK